MIQQEAGAAEGGTGQSPSVILWWVVSCSFPAQPFCLLGVPVLAFWQTGKLFSGLELGGGNVLWVYFQGAFRLADGLDCLPVLFSLHIYEVLLKQGEKSIKIKTQEVEVCFDLSMGKNPVCAITSWKALRM